MEGYKSLNIVAVTGANSGLGRALCDRLALNSGTAVIKINGPDTPGGFDFRDAEGIYQCAEFIRSKTEHNLDLWLGDRSYYPILINCAGVNYIEWFENADWNEFDRLMDINVKAQLMLIQELIGCDRHFDDTKNWFNNQGAILNIVSNASHVAMTNSAFYNATKGAMHIATLALARELRKTHGICIFGISPNKLKGTGMSEYIEDRVPGLRGWTPEQAAAYQLGALPAGEETDPVELADFIGYLLSKPNRHKFLTNTIIPYGA